ncbi:hypothetical protein H311_00702 [Anncaliia algerae PRA109]|nr:hypothetical protein H311_00702 [Anncaliia algerae PRA109]
MINYFINLNLVPMFNIFSEQKDKENKDSILMQILILDSIELLTGCTILWEHQN